MLSRAHENERAPKVVEHLHASGEPSPEFKEYLRCLKAHIDSCEFEPKLGSPKYEPWEAAQSAACDAPAAASHVIRDRIIRSERDFLEFVRVVQRSFGSAGPTVPGRSTHPIRNWRRRWQRRSFGGSREAQMSKRVKTEAVGLASPTKRGRRPAEAPVRLTPIGKLARELAQFYAAHNKLGEACDLLEYAGRSRNAPGETKPVEPSQKPVLDEAGNRLWDRIQALTRYLAHVEPQSTEDLATLSLIYADALDQFDYLDPELYDEDLREAFRNRPPIDEDKRREFRREQRYLTMFARKIENGLEVQTPSPLARYTRLRMGPKEHEHLCGFGSENHRREQQGWRQCLSAQPFSPAQVRGAFSFKSRLDCTG